MKFNCTYIFCIIFLMVSATNFAQDKIWVDADWNPTTIEKGLYYKTKISDDGTLSYYFKNNKIAKKETYVDGVLEGNYFEYFETGELKVAGKYEEGKRNGVWKVFYKNGKIKSRGKYRDGEKVGVWKTFYKNVY